ncbi:MAG TPA: diguanylate cyclase, partial [Pseudomonas sp.]|uniref:sensor domain-containing diguanylate cyclase n=1 Tax=Pseudomonas sp. TaxID=306 RepID=UPI002B473CA7
MEAVNGKRATSRKVITWRLILVFAGLMGLALVVGVVSLYRIAGTLDEREVKQSRFYAQSALHGLQQTQQAFLISYAFWQVGYDHLEGTVNRHWAFDEDNVGPTLYNNSGYQGVFVIDDAATGYAMLDGQLSEAPIEQFTNAKARILQQARLASQRDQATSGFVMFRGQPSLFVAAVIRPPAMPHHLPAPRSVMTFIRPLTPAFLGPLGSSVGLQGLAVDAAGDLPADRGYLPLADIGHGLTWQVPRPGTELVWAVVPPLAVALMFILVMMSVLGRYAVLSSARIDRSYQKLAESRDALEISEERFKAVAEGASDWIWETDTHLQISYLSARFEEVTGHPVDDWIGRSIRDLLECDTGRVAHWLQQLAISGMAGTLRCQYHDSLGQQRICRISARAIMHGGEHEGFRGTSTDITDEVAAHAQIQHLSQHDALTGLPNRNKLFRFIEQFMQGGEEDPQLAVLMLDLDNFKPINDSLGHSAGDAVLIEVATRLNAVTRGADLVARLGGDEFIVVLTQPGPVETLDRFCERVIQSLQAPIAFEDHQVRVSASLGVVLSREYGGRPSDLIKYADLALYSAKAAGKGTWRYFSVQLNEALLGKRELERELR